VSYILCEGLAKPKSRKESLMDRLRDRLRSNRANSTETCTDEPESTVKKIQKLSAKKEVHKVDKSESDIPLTASSSICK
jgi:hypothetical protein